VRFKATVVVYRKTTEWLSRVTLRAKKLIGIQSDLGKPVIPGSIPLKDHSMRRVHDHVQARLAARMRINTELLQHVFMNDPAAAKRLRATIETGRSLILRSMTEQRELVDSALSATPGLQETQIIDRWLMRHGSPTPEDPRSRRVVSVLEHQLYELDATIATAFMALDYCAVDLCEVDPNGPMAKVQLNDAATRLSMLVDIVGEQADAASRDDMACDLEDECSQNPARRLKPRRVITPGSS